MAADILYRRVYKAARKSPYVEEVTQMMDEKKNSHITTEKEKIGKVSGSESGNKGGT